ncbi:MAG TPA: DUF3298 domain-containing protein [Panacibacter sp.]|nr:DUF3298 domain-containing protein [Panacibacter sp.]
MKKINVLLVLWLSTFFAAAQSTESWYKVYTGKVGNLAATLHLHKAGKNFSGYIWFAQNQWPMPLFPGESTSNPDSISVSAISGPVSLVLSGVISGDNFNGNSILAKENSGEKKAPFQLQLSTDKTFTLFNYLYSEGNTTLAKKYNNDSQCDYFAATVWPSGNSTADPALKKQILQMLNIKTPAVQISKWLTDEKNKVLTTWKTENEKMPPKEVSEMGLSLSSQQEDRIMVMYENEQHITLADYSYSFSGGAHGNYTTTLACYNKQSSKRLQLPDVVNPAGIKLLPSLLDQVARLQYGIKNNKPLDQNSFLVNKILPAANFYITSSGIGFLYAPYEIKSFADGEVNLLIPFSALNNYLMPGYKH